MRTPILICTAIGIFAGTLFMGCASAAQKDEDAAARVSEAEQEQNEAQQVSMTVAQKMVTEEEWNAFRTDTETKVVQNEKRIAELRAKLSKPGKSFDKAYTNRIDSLERQNMNLKLRMSAYEQNKSDWIAFRRAFTHDMDALSKELKDFTVDNK